jgi:hypothetical protein
MTFVPEPYEQFLDDLLTTLTGGNAREEHQFAGPDGAYSLSTPGAIPFTLKVTGTRNEQYTVFEQGIEFTYDDSAQAIRWKPNAQMPDDASYFYVNYYVQDAPALLTDRNPGSVTTTLAEAFAREFAVLHKQMDGIYRSAFLDLANGSSLDHIAALLGLTRKDARFAGGEVLFKRSTPTPGDIVIPAGTVVSTDQGQNFETTDKRTLRRGQLSVAVPVRAQVDGTAGRVDTATVKNINRPIFGIDSVQNDAPTYFANSPETDAELKLRVRGTIERAGKSTVDAIRYGLIEDIPEVTEDNIEVSEDLQTAGLVQVKLGIQISTPDLVSRVEESIFNSRPAGVRVTHNLPTDSSSSSERAADAISRAQAVDDLKGQGEPADLNHLRPEILATMPDRVLPMRAEALLRLSGQNLTAAQKETIEDNVRTSIAGYINGLAMGAPLIFNKLLALVVQPDQIADATLLVGGEANGSFYSFKANLATDGRKAQIDRQRIFVGLMDETVFIDITVQLEVNPAATTQPPPKADALRALVADSVNQLLSAATGKLVTADLVAAIRSTLLAKAPQVQFVASNPVVVNAEFVESGRLLNHTDSVALADNESPSLRNLSVNLTGALDG